MKDVSISSRQRRSETPYHRIRGTLQAQTALDALKHEDAHSTLTGTTATSSRQIHTRPGQLFSGETISRGERSAVDPDCTQRRGGLPTIEPTDLGSCVTGLVNTLARGAAEQVAPHGLLPLDYAILRLCLVKDQWTVTQLARSLPFKAPHISRVVTGLVGRGLIRRRRRRSDRRVVFLALTDEGRVLTSELFRRIQSYEATLAQGVTEEEMEAFVSVTSKVIANYEALEQAKQT